VGLFEGQEEVGGEERWRRRRGEEAGGCLRQQVADALWELADRFDIGVWYSPVVNGVELDQPHCRTVDECVIQILEGYSRFFNIALGV
jgi:hypothetical protein